MSIKLKVILMLIASIQILCNEQYFFQIDDKIENTIEIDQNSEFTIEIGTYSGTGYSWIIEQQSVLLTTISINKVNNKDLMQPKAGNPILFQFKFKYSSIEKNNKLQNTKIVLGLKRPWEAKSLRTCTVNVQIK